jgi:hypothetical protein
MAVYSIHCDSSKFDHNQLIEKKLMKIRKALYPADNNLLILNKKSNNISTGPKCAIQ